MKNDGTPGLKGVVGEESCGCGMYTRRGFGLFLFSPVSLQGHGGDGVLSR